MGLYAMGKTAAVAAIRAAIDARISTTTDGTKILDVAGLHQWLYDEALTVINSDVAEQNRTAATGVLNTIDVTERTRTLESEVALGRWVGTPGYPTAAAISNSQSFVDAVIKSKQELESAVTGIEAEYTNIVAELPTVLTSAYAEYGMADGMPKTEDRLVESRVYVYTYVNDLGEESAPSPLSEMREVDQRDEVNISISAAPTGRNIDRWRFYRSNNGTVGAAFQFVAEGPITTTSGTDSVRSEVLGEVITTTTWAEPPVNLRGLVNMPNGVMAGFVNNYVAFCENNVPYAWPEEYQLTTEFPIVALGTFGQTLVVLHTGGVDYISGADAASMSMQKDVSKQACVSMRSVVSVDGGVVFASSTGLCLATQQGVQVLTEGKIAAADWDNLSPENCHCVVLDKTLYVYGLSVPVIYAYHLPTNKLGTLTFNQPYSAVFVDRQKGAIYGASGTSVYKLFSSGTRTGRWKTKNMVMPAQTGFAWLAVESLFNNGPVTVRWYGDGALRHTAVVSNRTPVRLPVGRWLEHEVEVESQSWVNKVTLASSGDELRAA